MNTTTVDYSDAMDQHQLSNVLDLLGVHNSSRFVVNNTPTPQNAVLRTGTIFFAYFTPVIIIVGIIGNSLSLSVFVSKNMRSLPASTYLAALSVADLSTLIFYVCAEWMRRGVEHLSGGTKIEFLDFNGICQIQLYFAYVSRFLSSWIVVTFTIERYIGVCHPLKRRGICTSNGSRKVILSLFILAISLVMYKPVLSTTKVTRGIHVCGYKDDYAFLSFVLDNIFAVSITFIPFTIITVLNALIMRSLFRRERFTKDLNVVSNEHVILLEFTLILLAISFCFIAFNLPYFVIWFHHFLKSKYLRSGDSLSFSTEKDQDYWKGVLLITRTIFYLNYCVNFFLYSITGGYFRREIKLLCRLRPRATENGINRRVVRLLSTHSNVQTTQSWV